MGFCCQFEKIAAKKAKYDYDKNHRKLHKTPWTEERQTGGFTQRFHPKTRRWSCDCQDFDYRRQHVPDTEGFDERNCKHIKSMLTGQTIGEVRANDVAGKIEKTAGEVFQVSKSDGPIERARKRFNKKAIEHSAKPPRKDYSRSIQELYEALKRSHNAIRV